MKKSIISIFVVLLSFYSFSATKYVAKTGNDSNDGSLSTPYLTIQKGVDVARAGDTILVKVGTYNERVVVYGYDGTESSPITIKNYPGDSPIIDGTGVSVGDGMSLVMIWEDWINVSGFEIQNVNIGVYATGVNNGYGTGLIISGNHCSVNDIIIHDTWSSGISVLYDYNTVDSCLVYHTAMSNSETPGLATNGGGIYHTSFANHCVIKNCVVYHVWGEGIGMGGTYNTLEDNIVYDCWESNMYSCNATNCLIQRNLIYQTGGMIVGSRCGILVGDENSTNLTENITIVNNVVYNCRRNFYYWGTNYTNGIDTALIANNTFVNSTYLSCVQFSPTTNPSVNLQFINNIVVQNEGLLPITISDNTGFTFSNNLYSSTPDVLASDTGDVIGDPLFKSSTDFSLQSNSPAINAGIDVGLTSDYLKHSIINIPDIGAYEYHSSSTPPAPSGTRRIRVLIVR